MPNYYLAVDIGASSGRHILGHLENGRMVLEEIHRFENGITDIGGTKCWDTEQLFAEIKAGMLKCSERGLIPLSMGLDTWGVDFVLLDANNRLCGNAVAYRDARTKGIDAEVYKIISEEQLYARTGIQKQLYNTVYQLMAVKHQSPQEIEAAETLLMTPDYYHFLLTGKKAAEYTIATTGQLVSPESRDWDWELIDMLGLPRRIFTPIQMPGTELGHLLPEVAAEVGFDCAVVLPASHDTASAVMAVPAMGKESLYISSGTWSLMGTESERAICTEESRRANLTNEGGYDFRFRFLKNIMGLWMIQSVRREYGKAYSFAELCQLAEAAGDFPSRVDVNDDSFFAPESMIEAIRDYCRKSAQPVPETPGEISAVVYRSLAESYRETVGEIESITGKTYECINIVGGGSNADYLNQLAANACGRTVYAGPTEATAIGNIAAQMLRAGEFESLEQARRNIFESFEVKTFEPGA